MQFLKTVLITLHSMIARSLVVTKLYFMFLSVVARHIPGDGNKERLISVLNTVKWQIVDLPAKEIFVTPSTKIKIIPHLGEFDFRAMVSSNLEYEPEVFSLLETRLNKYDAIVEIGANVGVYTVFFSNVLQRLQKSTAIFTFEPSREAYMRLQQNLQQNNAQYVFTFNCAVADCTRFLDFFEPKGHLTNGSLDPNFAGMFGETERYTVLVLDADLLSNLLENYQNILLKIDAEGAENEILKALESLLSKKKIEIVCELLPITCESLNNIEFILDNYDIFNITRNGLIQSDGFVPHGSFRDVLLSPKHHTKQNT